MPHGHIERTVGLNRRSWLGHRGRRARRRAGSSGWTRRGALLPAGDEPQTEQRTPTRFQIACMTLPYSQFPLQRALTGIKAAGYRYVAWGTTHVEEDGKRDARDRRRCAGRPARRSWASDAATWAWSRCMMFSGIYPEARRGLERAPSADPPGRGGRRSPGAHLRPYHAEAIASSGSSGSSSLDPWRAITA